MDGQRSTRFDVTLDELVRSARVPREEQSTVEPLPDPPPLLAPEDLARTRLLGISGAGRLRG